MFVHAELAYMFYIQTQPLVIFYAGCFSGTVTEARLSSTTLYKEEFIRELLCCMKGEKVSTPLDKDGNGPLGPATRIRLRHCHLLRGISNQVF